MTATRLFQSGVGEQIIKEMIGHKSDAVRMYKYSNTQILRQASSKLSAEDTENKENIPPKIDWEDAEYCDEVMTRVEPETVEIHTVPRQNKAHCTPCKTADKDGNCTALCNILKKIDDKQAECKVKKLKLSLKYRRK